MVPAYSYESICNELRRRLKENYEKSRKEMAKMVGILFARPGSRIAESEILPNLDYFHHRSGNNIDFFCGGYGMLWENWKDMFPDQTVVAKSKNENWLFSSIKFNEFREEIENMTKWQYSGSADLLITNAKYNTESGEAYLDFSSTVVCNLESMIEAKAINSIETFFEEIFRFAEKATGDDPTWGFSDTKGMSLGGSALKRFLLSLLPKTLGNDAERIEHFALRDVSA